MHLYVKTKIYLSSFIYMQNKITFVISKNMCYLLCYLGNMCKTNMQMLQIFFSSFKKKNLNYSNKLKNMLNSIQAVF